MALKDFSPAEVRILVRHGEHSNPIILLCDFIIGEDGNNSTHWEVGIRRFFFEEEEVEKALDLFSKQDEGASFSGNGDKLATTRFSGSGPIILIANVSGKSITEGEAKTAENLLLFKKEIAGKAFGKIDL